MKHAITVLALMVCSALAFAASPPADVTFVDGAATIRTKAGKTLEPQIGDTLASGDSLRTGSDGNVELDQKGLAIKLSPNTVFTLMERAQGGGQQTGVLAVTLGAVKVRYGRITGQEPMIQTVGCSAGVRGTELSIFAAADGTSLFVVDEGMVTVEASGKSVDLGPDEAVEVQNGRPPGDKFKVQRDQIDYRKWSEDKLEALMADPNAAMDGALARLQYYAQNATQYVEQYRQSKARLDEARAKMVQINTEQGKDAAQRFNQETVGPLVMETASEFLNSRYFMLAGLSLRRFVGGRVYLLLKTKYIMNQDDQAWIEFQGRYQAMLTEFESTLLPLLSDVDI
jgi:hypothetical protein